MNSTHDVDRLREVFSAFDPVRGAQFPTAVQQPAAESSAPSQAADRTPTRWSRVALVAAAVVATIVVPLAVFGSFNATPSDTSSASRQVAAAVADYQTMTTDRAFIQRAEQELISRCMAAAGFEYTPIEQLPARWRQLTQPLSVQAAEESGYASLTAPLTSPDAEANEKYMAALSKADRQRYATTLNGDPGHTAKITSPAGTVAIPTSGCVRQADRDLFGNAVKWAQASTFVTDVGNYPEYRPADDTTLKHATQEWSSCMADRGYRFATPDDAMQLALSEATPFNRLDANGNEVPQETAGAHPDKARDIAVADATCRAQTGWDDANRVAAQRALAAVFAAHESDVLAYNEMAAVGVAKARAVLGQ